MLPTINPALDIPLHQQIEAYLRTLITQEEYRKGKALPKEEMLAKQLGVSRNTFRAAMDNLVRDGLVLRKKGVGTFVTIPKINTSLNEWESFSREMDRQGRVIRTLEKSIEWTAADYMLSLELGVPVGSALCCLSRLKGVENEPVVLFKSYLHPRVGIDKAEVFDGKLYTILEEKYHCIVATSEEEIGAMQATKDLQQVLDSPPEVPLLYRKRRVLGPTGKLLELCYAYYRSDRFVYNLQINRG